MPGSQGRDHPGILRTKGEENTYSSDPPRIKGLNHSLLLDKETNKIITHYFFNMMFNMYEQVN